MRLFVGYGTQKKSVVTAAISSITSDDLKAQSNTRIESVLQGMTSGVTVTAPSGAPDAAVERMISVLRRRMNIIDTALR